jgi:hypothetical protein
MSTNGASEKSVRLPSFDGNEAHFQIWWLRFKAYAAVMGFLQSIGETADTDLPATEATVLADPTGADLSAVVAIKNNKIAMANFTMAFSTEGLMQMICSSFSTAWPGGRGSDVVKLLHHKFKPTDTMSKVEMTMAIREI